VHMVETPASKSILDITSIRNASNLGATGNSFVVSYF